MKFSGEKGMCEKVELQYNGSKPLLPKYNESFGVYEYLGTRIDCSTCPGVFALKAQNKVGLLFIDSFTGWGAGVKYSFSVFLKNLISLNLLYSI